MSFASPIWLIGLLPWAALVAWLLTGRRDEARVPFVHLWPRSAAPLRVRRRVHRPPPAIVCLLVGLLLAVLAAAGPRVVRAPNGARHDVTLVVDLDVTSPARNPEAIDLEPSRVVVVRGGGSEEVDPTSWRQRVGRFSSVPTLPVLRAAVAEALARDERPVVVVSNQRLDLDSPRLVQIESDPPLVNVGIVRMSARARPAGQVMLTLRNQSPQTRAELLIASDGDARRQSIDLPPPGGEKSYFIDMQAVGRVVTAAVETRDDIDADNLAWLVRRATWPHVEARGDLPPELARMIEAYRKLRPAEEGSKRVMVTTHEGDEPAAIIPDGGAEQPVDGPLQVADHPVAANVEWNDVLGTARVGEPPRGDWTPLVRAGARVLIAVRERPARQVWVGFHSDTWPRQSSFVIFWTIVFDWLGESGGEARAGEPVRQLGPEWQRLEDLSGGRASTTADPTPGIWGRSDGELRALNATDIRLNPPPPGDWRGRLAGIEQTTAPPRADLAKPALVAALAMALIASLTWASVKRGPGAA